MGNGRMPRFAPPQVEVETLAGGGMILRSPLALGAVDRCVGVWLDAWAGRAGGLEMGRGRERALASVPTLPSAPARAGARSPTLRRIRRRGRSARRC